VPDPLDHREEEFVLRTDRALTLLVEQLRQHGAEIVFAKLASTPDLVTAYVLMPTDPRETDECRQMIADWNA